MKKLKFICISSFVLLVACAVVICTNAKQLPYVLKTIQGDPTILENIKVTNSLYFESESSINLFINDGVVAYEYSNDSDFNKGYISDDEFKSHINYTREDPQMEERKLSENSVSFDPYTNERCELYDYPQTYADVEVQAYGLSSEPIETKLKMYAEEDYPIYYTNDDEGSPCYREEEKKKTMSYHFGVSESKIGKGSDENYYMMPTITSNMEGVAEIFRLRPTKQNRYNAYSEESIYAFDVERGTISTMHLYNDHIYLWTLKEDIATFQTFDLNMSLLHETKTAYSLSVTPMHSPLIYTNDQYMIIEVDQNIHVYDVETGELVFSDTKILKEQDLFYHEDVLYNGEYVYVCGVEDDREQYRDNVAILAFDKNNIIYKGKMELYENEYENKRKEDGTIYYNYGEMPYMVRGPISFVREP